MKRRAPLCLYAVLFFAVAANACPFINGSTCLFYGGDTDPNDPNNNGLENETDITVFGSPYGAATYQNFVYDGQTPITGLFTNNFIITNTIPKSGYWEIRSGVSEGNGGTLVASGTSALLNTPTGISNYGFPVVTTSVAISPTVLAAGTYWFAVVPECNPLCGPGSRSYNANTAGLNSVGTQISNEQFWNSSFFGANFTNADNEGVYPTFSSGVLTNGGIPEPSSILMLASGVLAAAGMVRRRMMR
jgi:hypothetical protein